MSKRTRAALSVLLAFALLLLGPTSGMAAQSKPSDSAVKADQEVKRALAERRADNRITQEEREQAAARLQLMQKLAAINSGNSVVKAAAVVPEPGGTPDYFGTWANWAWSPELRKFVDTLPGVGPAGENNLGQYISVAHPDTITYPGCDYYEIELIDYQEQLHSDLPPTTLRGYHQTNKGTDGDGNNTILPDPPHHLGPTIVARKDRPVRIKFTNNLGVGEAGDLFIPVDTSVMGAGMGPLGSNVPTGADPLYKQNRGTIHLHGGRTPWISDGTPHQWITPADENTPYPKGVSVRNVPDMPDPGDGSMTFFYSNQQSARMMFYHDHSMGITRLNVYAGEAAGYFLKDDAEDALVADGFLPSDELPLILEDKTFVDADTVRLTDPTWNWGTGAKDVNGVRTPVTGDLWYPHVYLPAQNPADPSGMNATGRWHYGPWFWPPTTNIEFPPVPNPYFDPINAPWEPELAPPFPNPSMVGEAWHDTPLVNGTAYPTVEVDPKAYRLRILNAASDRFWNLQMYIADSSRTTTWAGETEVKMVPASLSETYFPETWPTDAREGGVPDPRLAGPDWVQVGTEGGFLPKPAVIPNQPITWNGDPTTFNFGNVDLHSMLLAPAERADAVVDFSDYAGETLIVYNDAPAAFPAPDARNDYYTDDPDRTDTGGHPGTRAGYGPNTRTIMQIKVKNTTPADPFDLTALESAFASTDTTPGVFQASQHPILIPEARYDSAYNASFTADPYVRIYQNEMKIKTLTGQTVTMPLEPKAIQDEMGEAFDTQYGRMSGKLGLEMPRTNAGNANFILYGFQDPPTEKVKDAMVPLSPVLDDGTQVWKITHNGVDTHPIHFHLFEVQLLNRVGWDNAIRPPDDNELGWKDTVRVSPLEDTIVALRPIAPKQPFGIPDSIRPLDPTQPIGSSMGFSNLNPIDGQANEPPVTNQLYNFGWEYVWHCHILSHEEMDMMRPIAFDVAKELAAAPALTATGTPGAPVDMTWTDGTPAAAPSTWGNPANEVGYRIERAVRTGSTTGPFSVVQQPLANQTSATDTSTAFGITYIYRVVAFNAAGDSRSNNITIAPPAAAPTSLVGTVQDGPKVQLTWTDNATNETGFVIERSVNGGPFATYATPGPRTGTGSVTFSDTTVTAGTAYSYRVRAVVGSGSSGYSNTVTVNVRTVARISGADRYAVALNMAAQVYPGWTGVQHVVIASGETAAQFDALGASGLAGALDAPLLLNPAGSLRSDVASALANMPAGVKVHLIGGTTSLSSTVFNQVDALASTGAVDRISGADRYSTAAAIASRMSTELASAMPTSALIVNGSNTNVLFDALSASPVSAKMKYPVLLVTTSTVPAATTNALTSLGLTHRYIIGGTSTVNETVRTTLGVAAGDRISGADRYYTASAVATRAKSEGWLANTYYGFSSTVPDAATGGAFLAKKNGSLLYVTSSSVPAGTSSFLTNNKVGVVGGYVFGGTTSIPESVRLQIISIMQ